MNNKEFIESITLEGEIWCDIIGTQGNYKISTLGRVMSLVGKCKLLSVRKDKNGYMKINIGRYNKYKLSSLIHRLVAETFIPNPDNKPCIDHINGDKSDNNVNNLTWVTYHENSLNPITLSRLREGVLIHAKAILRVRNGKIEQSFKSIREAERKGFNRSIIQDCLKTGRTHKGYHWILSSDYDKLTNMSKNALNPDED